MVTNQLARLCGGPELVTQDVPLWYSDCFDLKAIKASSSRENSVPPFNYLEELELEVLLIIRDYQP